eukprot:scaffold620751_cov19-Prasinocladus_malaysianus.AAC.1
MCHQHCISTCTLHVTVHDCADFTGNGCHFTQRIVPYRHGWLTPVVRPVGGSTVSRDEVLNRTTQKAQLDQGEARHGRERSNLEHCMPSFFVYAWPTGIQPVLLSGGLGRRLH